MSKKPIKVLCAGDVNGKFQQLINRVTAINKKCGPFDVLFCVGEFFGPNNDENQKIINGEIEFPFSTYILVLGACCPLTASYYPLQSVEFSPNLTYLGRSGILTTASGLLVGYLSGIESTNEKANKFEFDEEAVDNLLIPVRANSSFQAIDILLTSVWPADVWKHSINQPTNEPTGSKLISRLASGLKPRYHFAGFGPHYERSPYRNHRILLESAQNVTRFIGLADVDNLRKEKWLYAFTIVPLKRLDKAELTIQPDNTTEFPYAQLLEEFIIKQNSREMLDSKKNGAQFFFDNEADPYEEDPVDRGGRKKRRFSGSFASNNEKRVQSIQPDTCWFCLSNVNVAKHLILAVGSSCYSAMPKGPLTDDHVLVMSIEHVQSLVAASDEIREEIFKFRDALVLMADRLNKVLCVFERNYKTSHLQLQCVPIPKTMGKALRNSFFNAARLKNIEFTMLNEGEQVWDLINEGCPYFYLELPDGTRAFTRSMAGFPMQFDREVLCGKSLLDAEDRIDWKNCELSEAEEIELINKLKINFKMFDFTDDDSDSD